MKVICSPGKIEQLIRMKHWFYILLPVFLAAGSGQLYAQKVRLAEPKMGHTLFAQFFLEDKDYYISYDKLWLRHWQYVHLSTSIGYWKGPYRHNWPSMKKYEDESARIQLSALFGKNGHYGIFGYTQYTSIYKGTDPTSGRASIGGVMYDYLHLGFRFQHPNGGLFVQFLVYPYTFRELWSYSETFSLGLGITLPVKPKRPWYLPEGYKYSP